LKGAIAKTSINEKKDSAVGYEFLPRLSELKFSTACPKKLNAADDIHSKAS
jgi:hypothetical protein